ncbi:MAG: GNAT family protein [Paracoccaceae bacterium]|nr:GNAT family protein [Paracoccaceae bacterium]MDG1737995.1 GNAT family protein [Paracoccaceae bacterium]MDG2259628.1 GNAT family protein [Paracoccaceae bacterium]
MSDRPIGPLVEGWTAPSVPENIDLQGTHARIVPLAPKYASDLFESFDGNDWVFDYLFEDPFQSVTAYAEWIAKVTQKSDPYFVAILDAGGVAIGAASFMRITPAMGVIEVGNINITPRGQRSTATTEAMFLMMQWAFENGYRRYEWKCNALNAPSRRAAQRFGFSFEGVFRRHMIVKGRNRDTAWFAITEDEWPALRRAYDTWLSSDNFNSTGRQLRSLKELTSDALVTRDPTVRT